MPLRRIAFAVAALACAWGAEAQLSKPESVVYDASKGRYLVSNVDGRSIVSCTEATTCGSGTVFASGLTGPKGLAIVGDTLYTADQPAVKGFSLATGAKVLDVTIVGSSFLNDVASDAAGNLYISDIDTGKIHAIAPGATTATTLASGLSRPNGLLYDQAGNRLITASYQTNGDISGVDLGTGAVTRITSTTLSNLDGIARDGTGQIYVTAWGTNAVYRFDPGFTSAPVLLQAGFSSPADLCYDPGLNQLVVPNMKTNTISTVALPNPGTFVPVVVSAPGVTPGSLFTSELTLTNRSAKAVAVHLTYTATVGGGGGTTTDTLAAGEQKIEADAVDYLRRLSSTIVPATGTCVGTLRVDFEGAAAGETSASVRVGSPVSGGWASLSFQGLGPAGGQQGTSFVFGLRQDGTDRSNLALQNVGTTGNVTLRVTVTSGDPSSPGSVVLTPDQTLGPGGFYQYNSVLRAASPIWTNGWVKVERVSGTAPYNAYGVVNDQQNSDGSYVAAVADGAATGRSTMTIPVVVEAGPYCTELVLTNTGSKSKTLTLQLVADGITGGSAEVTVTLAAQEQRVIRSFVQYLRDQGVAGIGAAGTVKPGPLFVRPAAGDLTGIVAGARTWNPDGLGGFYGLFYTAVPGGTAAPARAWVYGMQQTSTTRSNLAIVNTGEVDSSSSQYLIELFDGTNGAASGTKTLTLDAKKWDQIGMVLLAPELAPAGVTNGYFRVTRQTGNNPFIAYGVVNDGASPGQRSGDGAFVTMEVQRP